MTGRQPLNGATVVLGRLPERHDSVVCLLFAGDRPVLVRHRRRAWEFPGGHTEPGEDPEATARREAREEAGAELGEVHVAGHYVLRDGHTTVVTHAQVAALAPLTGEFETAEVRAFDTLPHDLSWDDGIYAHLLRALGLPGAPPPRG
ncbi:NUDIX domain-containing protein [Streptomonospora nanhaiensis]|uniref:8-oxo-dGTP diphosphatase n=1 Tax=Streptomonospora nanhaiensis TaxID=1323731 RepID=A0A853BXH3_9ACTN|nr:NUDIX domain-containing protein [Streptomonospora nanhaiensis]MBV2365699.1 NUDIX domain-containing protein [Streptomonospora nanhaiensis]MBX9391446.1 NUDIX domain-containing protein [Streptomonospora nanhaiensis]NYI98862.1 8-oxo-dGTP diphosphatase [Streptomonospora nanhaiensis]